MSDPGYSRHSTNRKDISWVASCDTCDLEFEIEVEQASEDGQEYVENAFAELVAGHESECGGTVGWMREDEQTEVLE